MHYLQNKHIHRYHSYSKILKETTCTMWKQYKTLIFFCKIVKLRDSKSYNAKHAILQLCNCHCSLYVATVFDDD